MNKAFIIKESFGYAMGVFLVFAETEKEAKTKLFFSTKSIARRDNKGERTVIMEVQANKSQEDVIELGAYLE